MRVMRASATPRRGSLPLLLALSALCWSSCVEHPPGNRVTMEPVFSRAPVDWLGGRPFLVSPGGKFLVFSLSADESPPVDLSEREWSLSSLAAVRILDLESHAVRSPRVASSARRLLASNHGAIAHLRCWARSEPVLRMSTTSRPRLTLDARDANPAWRVAEGAGPPPPCPDREIPRPPVRAGRYEVRITEGGDLRVRHGPEDRVVFEADAPLWQAIRLHQLTLSPDGRHLGLVYSTALGSFTGWHWSVVVTAAPSGAADVRVLEPRARYLQWHPESQTIFGYGRNPEGDGSAIYRATIDG